MKEVISWLLSVPVNQMVTVALPLVLWFLEFV